MDEVYDCSAVIILRLSQQGHARAMHLDDELFPFLVDDRLDAAQLQAFEFIGDIL